MEHNFAKGCLNSYNQFWQRNPFSNKLSSFSPFTRFFDSIIHKISHWIFTNLKPISNFHRLTDLVIYKQICLNINVSFLSLFDFLPENMLNVFWEKAFSALWLSRHPNNILGSFLTEIFHIKCHFNSYKIQGLHVKRVI